MTGTDARGRGMLDSWPAVAFVALAAAATFARSLAGGFVWDDHVAIVSNAAVQKPESWLRFFADADVDPYGYVRPLRSMEFALDRALFGDGPFAFHLHSLAWHVAASALVLLVLRRLLGPGGAGAAFAAALFWAVHPVQVDPVAWIASRGHVAMGACSLLAVLGALRTGGRDGWLAASLAAAAVGTLYSESALVLPLAVVVLRWTRFSRAPIWPYVVVAALFLVYRFAVRRAPTETVATYVLGGSAAGAFATMSRAFGFYLVEALVPANSLDWYMTPSSSIVDGAALSWLAVHAALVASAVAARARAPQWTVAVAWFYLFLLPVSNWPVFTGAPTAERYMYAALVGPALAVGWALTRAPRGAWPAALVAAAALTSASVDRISKWRDDDSLWRGILADHESPLARIQLADAAVNRALTLRSDAASMPSGPARDEATARAESSLVEALDHAHRAIDDVRAFELYASPHLRWAWQPECLASRACWLLGRHAEALFHAEESIRVGAGGDARPELTRAFVLLSLGFAPQAAASMRRAQEQGLTRENASVGEFFLRAAEACEARGLTDCARAACESAIAATPDGPRRDEARARLDVLSRAPVDAAREAAEIERLDDELARLPRGCPSRRPAK
jgi:hypothetical protein